MLICWQYNDIYTHYIVVVIHSVSCCLLLLLSFGAAATHTVVVVIDYIVGLEKSDQSIDMQRRRRGSQAASITVLPTNSFTFFFAHTHYWYREIPVSIH